MHTYLWGKEGYMAIKLDMSKAYEWVEWGFLEAVMGRMSFDSRWTELIMSCVQTMNYVVIVNGIPTG
jgi:hypothetical protein